MKDTIYVYITQGSERGIAGEVIYKALKNLRLNKIKYIFVGDKKVFERYNINFPDFSKLFDELFLFSKTKESSFESVKKAAEIILSKKNGVLVTPPISKKVWIKNGYNYRGHTEFFEKYLNKKTIMFFWHKDLKLSLFTHHIPLNSLFSKIEKKSIELFFKKLYNELNQRFGFKFNYVFSSINPHAGEDGELGKEEKNTIKPVVEKLKNEGFQVDGPFPNDTVFYKFRGKKNTVIISFAHDFGLPVFKTLYFHTGVNVTLGLPFIRTSPDHGTGEDIEGLGIANEKAMENAIKIAVYLKKHEKKDG